MKKIYIVVAILFLAGIVVFYAGKNRQPMRNTSAPPNQSQSGAMSAAPLGVQEKHVVIVLEENIRYSDAIGNTKDMPYLNSLANDYASAKNYFGSKHPSIANYFMLTTGQAISADNNFKDVVSKDNLARIFIAAGKTWKEYSESLPEAGYTGGDQGPYRQHHNPFSYFSDVREYGGQRQNLVSFDNLAKDIAEKNLPDYAMIVPDNRHNIHDCETGIFCTGSERRAAADEWLKANISPLLASPDFSETGGGLLIVTADEGSKADNTHGGGHTFWIAAGPDLKKGYASDTFYQHENTLRFICELLGLASCPGKAASASNMAEFLVGH